MTRKPEEKKCCPKLYFVKNDEFFLQKHKNCKIGTFRFLTISLTISWLQRCTIPNFNPQIDL